MILLYILLVTTASVFGSTDFDEVCPSDGCFLWHMHTNFSAKLAPKVIWLELSHYLDSKVFELTPNLKRLHMIACSSINLQDVTPLANLEEMKVYGVNMSQLQNDHFAKMPSLEVLHLNRNSIESLSNGTFQSLSKLEILDLRINFIKFLPDGLFYPLKDLQSVDLSNNQISVISENTFSGNKRLRWLYLRENPVKRLDLPKGIFQKSMEVLSLVNCGQLKNLLLSFNITELRLDNSGVESLQSDGIIERISLANTNLTHVNLRGSQWDIYPYENIICELRNLEWLDLSNTSINTPVPFKMSSTHGDCQLPDLKFLNLSSNQLVNLPLEYPFLMRTLASLDLSHNKLETIPLDAFDDFHDLRSLRLEGNNLRSFDYRDFYNRHRSLKELALYDNKFNSSFFNEIIHYSCYKGLPLIQENNHTLSATECQDLLGMNFGY